MYHKRPDTTDTIVALSSPPGVACRGIIRIAGDAAFSVIESVLSQSITPELLGQPARHLIPVRIAKPPIPALAVRFESPASYTAENMIELHVPGNPALLDRIIHTLIEAGCRIAEPGEFTFRAFSAGKLDLTEAEGVAATIAAVSDGQLHAAGLLRTGRLGRIAKMLVSQTADLLARVEAAIDFTDEEDVVIIDQDELLTELQKLNDRIRRLLRNSRPWKAVETVPRVVLAGPPSVGKSTLFNAMLGTRRAVISELPGTTRDVLAEPVTFTDPQNRTVELILVDIAGLGVPTTSLDQAVQRMAAEAIQQADLILLIRSPDCNTSDNDTISIPPGAAVLPVLAKSDLLSRQLTEPTDTMLVSANTGNGLQQLKWRIIELLGRHATTGLADMLVLQPRHEQRLRQANTAIKQACLLITEQTGHTVIKHIELVAGQLRTALNELACLGGEMTPDDILGRIFANFCIGK